MQSDQLTKVLSLGRAETIIYLSKLGIEHESCDGGPSCVCDFEELQALLLSFCYCVPNFSLLYEVADGFEESFDLVQILVDSNDGRLTNDAVQQLVEQENRSVSTISLSRCVGVHKSLDPCLDSNTLIVATESTCDDDAQISKTLSSTDIFDQTGSSVAEVTLHQVTYNATSSMFTKENRWGIQVIAPPLPFGVNEYTVKLVRMQTGNSTGPIRQQYSWQDTVLVTSAVHRYAAALDCMFDRLYWGWEGNWNQSLENAVLQLLVAVDDDLVGMVRSWVSMMSGAGSAMRDGASDMQRLLDCVVSDVQKAMNEHSTYAVGRLHQTLVQFVDAKDSMSMMMRIPEGFTHAINDFMQAKLEASAQVEMQRDLDALVRSARDFLHQLLSTTAGLAQKGKIAALQAFLQAADAKASDTAAVVGVAPTAVNIELARLIHDLKPQAMEIMATAAIANWSTNKVDLLPYIPLTTVRDLALLGKCAHQLCETLIMDAFNLDTFMGYHMRADNVPESAAIISSLLEVGFAYVASESGKLLGLLPMQRSMLVLNDPRNGVRREPSIGASVETSAVSGAKSGDKASKQQAGSKRKAPTAQAQPEALSSTSGPAQVGTKYGHGEWVTTDGTEDNHSYERPYFPFVMPAQLRRRAKDMQRVFRNNVKKPFSLRLNSNFDLAVQKLHEHHGSDCWVGPALQSVWRCMAATSPPQLLIFELWYGEDMIAADYAHPTNGGSSVYVATRFFDRSAAVRNLIPGFLLALVETKYLQRQGCNIWDLGTANLCPLMRYKLDLTGEPYDRLQAFYELACAANAVAAQKAAGAKGAQTNSMDGLRAGVLIENITIHELLSDE